jgi:hypothetical protein
MLPDLALDWQDDAPPLDTWVIGDVQAVLQSRADRLGALPAVVTHGLGALSAGAPAAAGEGIVLRGWTGVTPPTAQAGTAFTYHPTTEQVSTPFFMGWAGAAIARGRLAGDAAVTLRQVYEAIFERLWARPAMAATPVIFLELLGLFPATEIYDRALQAPVHADHVLITDAAHAPHYFTFKIIQHDLHARNVAPDQLLPLAVVGAGFNPQTAAPELRRFERAAFYAPPQTTEGVQHEGASGLKTHSHAIGWRAAPALHAQLTHAARQPDWRAALHELDSVVLPELLEAPPDYVVHLDEWSRLVVGVFRVFVPNASDGIRFVAV